jgi:phage terminase large subunit GpA-like protein
MKGAQLGVTEVAINRSLYTLDALQRDVMYILPTAGAAGDFSKTRFASALALSPYIDGMFTDTNSVGLKRAGANSLYIRGSRSRTGLKSAPVSELVLDEVDEMDIDAVLVLAKERLSGQIHKHTWGISTPTIPEFGVHKLFIGSTQEHFLFRCPGCGQLIELKWPDNIEIIGECATDPRCAESYLKCKCGRKLPHEEKPLYLANGVWVPTKTGCTTRGFHVNQLYSYTMSPGEIVAAYLKSIGDELATKEFFNSKLGLPWVGAGARITDEMLANAVRDHSMNDLRPSSGGLRLITLGVDQGITN